MEDELFIFTKTVFLLEDENPTEENISNFKDALSFIETLRKEAYLYATPEEQYESQYLTVQEHIVSTHKILLMGSDGKAGTIRRAFQDVYPSHEDENTYSRGEFVETHLYAMVDRYNESMKRLWNWNGKKDDDEFERKWISLGMWLVLRFLTIHPFMDGNGRMAHLLFQNHMRPITKYTAPIAANASSRYAYLDAIRQDRKNGNTNMLETLFRLQYSKT